MNSSPIKTLRKAKAWSQVHLADAAGVSVRTIQRLERTGQGADETLLSVAAALDVDVQILTQLNPQRIQGSYLTETPSPRPLWNTSSPAQTSLWGLLLLVPSTLFIASNLLKYTFEWPGLYDLLEAIGTTTGLAHAADVFLHPTFLLGSAFMAGLLSLMAQVQVTGQDTDDGFTLTGLRFSFHRMSTLVLLGAFLGLGIMLGYATLENIAHWIIELTTT